MALMTEQELDRIWGVLWDETTDRSKGSFKRALWYGGRISSKVGLDKGARKAIRNTPRKVLTLGVKQIPEVGPILGKVADPAAGAVKQIYSKYIKTRIKKEPSGTEASRKVAKRAVKDLKKGDTMKVIDRNLVKMKDARRKASQKLADYNSASNQGDDVRKEKAEAAIRSIFEVWYYEHKIIDLSSRVQAVMDELNRGIANLHSDTANTCQDLYDDLTKIA
jgi:hypothetical protein